jgi:hypothetical protein
MTIIKAGARAPDDDVVPACVESSAFVCYTNKECFPCSVVKNLHAVMRNDISGGVINVIKTRNTRIA